MYAFEDTLGVPVTFVKLVIFDKINTLNYLHNQNNTYTCIVTRR